MRPAPRALCSGSGAPLADGIILFHHTDAHRLKSPVRRLFACGRTNCNAIRTCRPMQSTMCIARSKGFARHVPDFIPRCQTPVMLARIGCGLWPRHHCAVYCRARDAGSLSSSVRPCASARQNTERSKSVRSLRRRTHPRRPGPVRVSVCATNCRVAPFSVRNPAVSCWPADESDEAGRGRRSPACGTDRSARAVRPRTLFCSKAKITLSSIDSNNELIDGRAKTTRFSIISRFNSKLQFP